MAPLGPLALHFQMESANEWQLAEVEDRGGEGTGVFIPQALPVGSGLAAVGFLYQMPLLLLGGLSLPPPNFSAFPVNAASPCPQQSTVALPLFTIPRWLP